MDILLIAFVYNELPYIEKMVSYYKSQGLNVYIIDNMSNDGTYEWLLENNIECSRFNTNESFDLTLLQAEVYRVIMLKKPDWIVYAAADLYYVFDKPINEIIWDHDLLGYNQLIVKCYGALNTGEEFNTPLYKNYIHGKFYRNLTMISKYDIDLKMNGDNILIPNINNIEVPGIMVNYGACKPKNEQIIKLKRRQSAWDNGLSERTGKHFKSGSLIDWTWNKDDYLNFLEGTDSKYFKKLIHEN